MPAISPCEYELITIESDQGVTVDLRLGVVSFQYFEDLFSPTITAKMIIISTSCVVSDDKTNKIESLYNGLPIRVAVNTVVPTISACHIANPC